MDTAKAICRNEDLEKINLKVDVQKSRMAYGKNVLPGNTNTEGHALTFNSQNVSSNLFVTC
jgi:D-aminopeptidase